jgi:hypothetical protein
MDTITDLRNIANVKTQAGSPYANAAIVLLCSTDGDYYLDSNIFSLPLHQSSEYSNTTEDASVSLEDGTKVTIEGGETTVSLKLTVVQQDAASMSFAEDMAGKILCVVKEVYTSSVNGQHYYHVFPGMKVAPSFTKSAPGATFDLTFNNVPLTGALTLDLKNWGDGFANPLTCATYVIPSGTKHLTYTENDPTT